MLARGGAADKSRDSVGSDAYRSREVLIKGGGEIE